MMYTLAMSIDGDFNRQRQCLPPAVILPLSGDGGDGAGGDSVFFRIAAVVARGLHPPITRQRKDYLRRSMSRSVGVSRSKAPAFKPRRTRAHHRRSVSRHRVADNWRRRKLRLSVKHTDLLESEIPDGGALVGGSGCPAEGPHGGDSIAFRAPMIVPAPNVRISGKGAMRCGR